ncbi:MAG: nucleoside phosphorylase [Bacilli bacterium]|nr:nucleoside phosphorylase [Bacilli bacterium]
MSILDAYDPKGEPLISPQDFYPKQEPLCDTAVACFSLAAHEYVLSHYEHTLFYRFRATANGVMDVYYLPTLRVYFYLSPVGAPVAAGFLQEVAHFAGAKKFVYFGSCGTLDPNAKGKYLVPTSCYREEGFSYHYAPPSEYMDITHHGIVSSFFKKENIDYAEGKGWTTDAIYNETKAKVEARRKEGVICVDMEASALQAICDHLGLSFYTFFFSADVLEDSWDVGDLGGDREARRQTQAAEVALKLSQSL